MARNNARRPTRTAEPPASEPRANQAEAAVATLEAPPAPAHKPGIIPGRLAQRFTMPEKRQLYYAELWPDQVPKPHPTQPNIFVNRDGTTFQARKKNCGDFSALVLKVQPASGGPVREIGLPLRTEEADYPTKDGEEVVDRIEVLFDFEDQMQRYLAKNGTATNDPLIRSLVKSGGDPRLFDQMGSKE